jgi:anthranilate phosphoribosyltransferase
MKLFLTLIMSVLFTAAAFATPGDVVVADDDVVVCVQDVDDVAEFGFVTVVHIETPLERCYVFSYEDFTVQSHSERWVAGEDPIIQCSWSTGVLSSYNHRKHKDYVAGIDPIKQC